LMHAHLRSDEENKLHLLEEAKLAARIRHPNVVAVQEIDEDPFGVFLVMDYVEGETLSGLVKLASEANTPLPYRMMARILNDALLGLHAAHELKDTSGEPLNIVHRDFSPQNILVGVQGQTQLGDFGVAKAADRAVRTKTGLTKGKIAYMAPEQARGHAVDRRCDVWAAGVVAWELIARRRMHKSDDDVATLLSIVTEVPPRLSSVVPDIPASLDEVLAWALQPDLAKRCPDADEFRRALEAAWEDLDGIATCAELAEYVTEVISPELSERHSRIEEVQKLRLRMGELTRSRLQAGGSTSSGEVRRPSRPDDDGSASARPRNIESAPTTLAVAGVSPPVPPPTAPLPRDLLVAPHNDSLDAAEFGTDSQPGAFDPDDTAATRVLPSTNFLHREVTQTSAVVPTWQTPRQRGRAVLIAVGVLSAAAAAAIWLSADPAAGPATSEAPAGERERASNETQAAPAVARPNPSSDERQVLELEDLELEKPGSPGGPDDARGASARASSGINTPATKVRRTLKSTAPQAHKYRPKPKAVQPPSHPRVTREKPRLATSPYDETKSGE